MINVPLGQILKAQGIITDAQLNEAIKYKNEKGAGKKLGDILVELKFITEMELIKALGKRLQLSIIETEIPRVPDNVAKAIPESVARKLEMVPVDIKEGRLYVATNDPLNYQALEDVRIATMGMEVVPVLATRDNIRQAMQKFYADKSVKDIAENIKERNENTLKQDADTLAMEERVDNTPIAKIINTILLQAYAKGASDIHIEPMEIVTNVRLRIDGMLVEYMQLKPSVYKAVITRLKIMSELNIAEKRIPQDGRFSFNATETKKIDVRVSTLPTVWGEKCVMRLLGGMDNKIKTLKELGMSKHNLSLFNQIIKNPNGIILMTGPTGSGKTTTLYSILHDVAKPEYNVTTIEDPVEIDLKGINQVQVNVKAGMTFAAGLRSILRQDPDIVMIGEIRDAETVEIAIRAAITGHLVLSTLHTNDAASSITRLIDMGVESYLVASSLVGIVAQRLVRKICPHCRATRKLTEEEKIISGIDDISDVAYGKGCDKCNNTGYLGRTSIHEILVVDDKMRSLVTNGASVEQLRDLAKMRGTISLKENMQILVRDQVTTVEELVKVAYSID